MNKITYRGRNETQRKVKYTTLDQQNARTAKCQNIKICERTRLGVIL